MVAVEEVVISRRRSIGHGSGRQWSWWSSWCGGGAWDVAAVVAVFVVAVVVRRRVLKYADMKID